MIRPPQLCLVWQHLLMKHSKDKALIIIPYRRAKRSQVFKYSLAILCPLMHAASLDVNRSYILKWNGKADPSGHKNNHIQSTTK